MSLHCFPKQIHLGGRINWRVVHGLGESQGGAGTGPDGVGAAQLEPSQTTRLVGGTWLIVHSEIYRLACALYIPIYFVYLASTILVLHIPRPAFLGFRSYCIFVDYGLDPITNTNFAVNLPVI